MLVTLVDFGTPGFDELVYLRDMMLRKPLALSFTPKELSSEYNSFHLGAYSDDLELLGTLVMKPLDQNQIKMRQVAVFPHAQRKGVGQLMVAASERLAREKNFKEIVLSARVPAVPFYERLNYDVVSEMYKEVGIDHFKMSKKMI